MSTAKHQEKSILNTAAKAVEKRQWKKGKALNSAARLRKAVAKQYPHSHSRIEFVNDVLRNDQDNTDVSPPELAVTRIDQMSFFTKR